jgi:hypothetical protein
LFPDGLSGDASPLVQRNPLRAHDIDDVMAVDRLEQKLSGNLGDVLGGNERRFRRSRDRSVDAVLSDDRRQREKLVERIVRVNVSGLLVENRSPGT